MPVVASEEAAVFLFLWPFSTLVISKASKKERNVNLIIQIFPSMKGLRLKNNHIFRTFLRNNIFYMCVWLSQNPHDLRSIVAKFTFTLFNV